MAVLSLKMKSSLGMLGKFAKMLDFPTDAFGSVPVIELKGNCEATVYGCNRVIAYSRESVRLKILKNELEIEGAELVLSDFTSGMVSVMGKISAVRFFDND